ncbi:T9SS type A sorting domain-containing protein [Polaribacter sp. BAL334]|uniref:T9SS type A sorting domain-containing protein n=1 Tax=Polaribacter sp. BAL334 TaxID=1708178 RepID=UPI0018D23629|nr:T9SS type A sorting domain-containing protein [Polaribacter sp. BAL334]MBG7612061.1 T9SS type A sorting domain-containing protein [Polaribacter sp. BAL334]
MKTKFTILMSLMFWNLIIAQYQFTLVDDINPESGNSFPKFPIETNGSLYFNATNNNQEKLYRTTNGTNAELVSDINGTSGYDPIPFAAINNKLLFFATTSAAGTELFVTDGTNSGTSILKDIYPGDTGILSNFIRDQFAVLNSELYFWTKGQDNKYFLWKTDGTTTGTLQITPDNDGFFYPSDVMIVYNNMIYFDARKNSFDNYNKLFRTDGTASGTVLFQDIPITINTESNPTDFIVYNNLLYYSAGNDNGAFGKELWRTNGTVDGTELVADIFPNNITNTSKSSSPAHFIIFNDELYFRAKGFSTEGNQSIGNELFKYNPNDGVVLVKEFYPGTLSGIATGKPFFIMDNILYVIARDGSTGVFEELWKSTDGTTSGVSKAITLSSLGVGSGGFSEVLQFDNGIVLNDKFYFVNVSSLWVTKGDNASTEKLTNPINIFDFSIPNLSDFRNSNIIFNNELYFAGSNNLGVELWKLTDNSLSTNEHNNSITQKLNIFPNPASNIVIIKMDDEIEIENVEIYNLLGKKVYTHKTSNQQNTEINISNLSKGMYLVKVKVNNFIISKKLVVH